MKEKFIKLIFIAILILMSSCSKDENQEPNEQSEINDVTTVYDGIQLSEIEQIYSSLLFDGGSFTMIDIPIHIHLVYKNDGSGTSLSGAEIQSLTNRLNQLYNNKSKLNFQVCEIKVLNDTDIYNFNISQNSLINQLRNNHSNTDVLNIYFVNDIIEIGSGTINGFFSTNGVGDKNSFVLIDRHYLALPYTTLEHEVGHFFYLYHTHGNTNCGFTTAGDFVDDTPFDTNLIGDCLGYRVDVNCNYIGNDGYNPDTHNIMSYSRPSCKTHLSNGQLIRVGNVARNANLRGYLSSNACSNSGNDCDNLQLGILHTEPGQYSQLPFVYTCPSIYNGANPQQFKMIGITNSNFSTNWQNSNLFNITQAGVYKFLIKDNNGCEKEITQTFPWN